MLWRLTTDLVMATGPHSTLTRSLTSVLEREAIPREMMGHAEALLGRVVHGWQDQELQARLLVTVVAVGPHERP
jgi:hypothetical protein